MPENCAVIVGSGFAGSIDSADSKPTTNRFGVPSAVVRETEFGGRSVLTLPRHGDDHVIPPHAINYRANLQSLYERGATAVIALCTVGAVTDVCAPGKIALPDQLLDYTWGRDHTVFDGRDGIVEHIDFTNPFSSELRQRLLRAAADCYDGGVYAATQGPRLETAAEVVRLQRDGADFVGMTAMPEAAIAREFGIEYVCLALVVNKAAGRGNAPIHDELKSTTAAARADAKSALDHFFAASGTL